MQGYNGSKKMIKILLKGQSIKDLTIETKKDGKTLW